MAMQLKSTAARTFVLTVALEALIHQLPGQGGGLGNITLH